MPFPYADRAIASVRPALILTDFDRFGQKSGVALVAMITTGKRSAWPFDFPIADLESAGLAHACVVRCKLNSIDYKLMEKKIGRLSEIDQQSVKSALGNLFTDVGLTVRT
jgi:mRNA-degrading endonuclease toxin of MazEF toxin-antitoxin module